MLNHFKMLIPLFILEMLLFKMLIDTDDWFWFIIGSIFLLVIGFFLITDDRETPLIIEDKQFSMKHITKMKTIQYADIKRVTIEFDSHRSNIEGGKQARSVYLKIAYNKHDMIHIPHHHAEQYQELIHALKQHPHIHISETILANEDQLLELTQKWLDGYTWAIDKVIVKGIVEDYANDNNISIRDAKSELIKHGIKEIGCLMILFIVFVFTCIVLFS